ncbi:MAG: FadR family transcriptional regulator, partial [bacterium]|nr:FadR family transcriptional regulator [bacterium]
MNDVIRITHVRQDTSKLSDRVVVALQQRVLSGELSVGSRLPTESELCEMFQVSRTVIRDALRTLTAMGLISVEHGRGISVTQPNDRSAGAAMAILLLRSELTIGEILDARSVVETELCSLAARYATEEDIGRIRRHLESFRAAAAAR